VQCLAHGETAGCKGPAGGGHKSKLRLGLGLLKNSTWLVGSGVCRTNDSAFQVRERFGARTTVETKVLSMESNISRAYVTISWSFSPCPSGEKPHPDGVPLAAICTLRYLFATGQAPLAVSRSVPRLANGVRPYRLLAKLTARSKMGQAENLV
jgi:hypothetical protein